MGTTSTSSSTWVRARAGAQSSTNIVESTESSGSELQIVPSSYYDAKAREGDPKGGIKHRIVTIGPRAVQPKRCRLNTTLFALVSESCFLSYALHHQGKLESWVAAEVPFKLR
jgi:hypothetical protein